MKRDELAVLADIVLGRDPIHAQAVVSEFRRLIAYVISAVFGLLVIGFMLMFVYWLYKLLPMMWSCR